MGRQSQTGHPVFLILFALLFMGAAFAPLPFQTSLNMALEESVILESPVPAAVSASVERKLSETLPEKPTREIFYRQYLVSRLIAASA